MDDKKDEYSYRYPRESAEGQKRFYHCTGFQLCPCCMFILKHSNSQQCSIWLANENHSHKENNKRRLPISSIRKVKELVDNGMKSNKNIINKLKELKLPQVSSKQISNLKQRVKGKLYIVNLIFFPPIKFIFY